MPFDVTNITVHKYKFHIYEEMLSNEGSCA